MNCSYVRILPKSDKRKKKALCSFEVMSIVGSVLLTKTVQFIKIVEVFFLKCRDSLHRFEFAYSDSAVILNQFIACSKSCSTRSATVFTWSCPSIIFSYLKLAWKGECFSDQDIQCHIQCSSFDTERKLCQQFFRNVIKNVLQTTDIIPNIIHFSWFR